MLIQNLNVDYIVLFMVLPITTIIPAYNCAATLERAVTSVLNQTQLPASILIINNRSTDSTHKLAHSLARKNKTITVLDDPIPGAAHARNTGLRAAQTPWVAFLDADDAWHPDKLNQISHLLTHDTCLVCHDFINVSPTDTIHVQTAKGQARHPDRLTALWLGNFIGTSTVVASREALLKAGGFATHMPYAEDYTLWLKLLATNSQHIHAVPNILSTRYVTDGSLSSYPWRNLYFTLRTHLYYLPTVIMRKAFWQRRSLFALGRLIIRRLIP